MQPQASLRKPREILGVVLVASNQATKVVKPSEQAFDFPSSPIPSQRASVLGGVFAVAPMGSDQFDTLLLQLLIQRIGVVRPIPDQALRLFREEVLLKLASMKASETSRPPRARRSSANTSRMRVRIPWCTQR